MTRRNFAASLLAGRFRTFAPKSALAAQAVAPPVPDPRVKKVLVMFKCHLDMGFTDTQANVVQKYFDVYFTRAIETAAEMARLGADRYIWTTGSWLLYSYLEKSAGPQRRRMEQAIAEGCIAWHAIPFSWQTELMDQSLIAGALGFAASLDRRFGRRTTGAKMTDVPGHTRALIAPLAAGGVTFLDIGVNSASTPAGVPPLFLWKDPAGRSLVTMYHHGYGAIAVVPRADLAIDVEVRGDNKGPHSTEEIQQIYSGLRRRFPNAQVTASDLSGIADAIEPHRGRLPVVTREIGDTWIYGAPSDPLKMARYREIARLRCEWIASRNWQPGDPADLAFLRRFLLDVEHTWGVDTKTWLDFDHYTPPDLARMLDQPKYQAVQSSWAEKRRNLFDALDMLPAPLRAEAARRVTALQPAVPAIAGLSPHPPAEPIEAKHFELALDPRTGAICRLRDKRSGRDWASPAHPLALFSYQTLSQADYDRFFAAYLRSNADWARKDFGKPNIERFGARSGTSLPVVSECLHGCDTAGHRIVARLQMEDAAPAKLYLEFFLPEAQPAIEINLSWFGKVANRMPEALWLSFQPANTLPGGWRLDKSGAGISPFDVIEGGNRTMHAVQKGIRYAGPEGAWSIESLDAPVVALGEKNPLGFSRSQPGLSRGFHFNLFNNAWGTNYVQWFGEDMRFRFRIRA